MKILVDTNVHARSVESSHTHHGSAVDAIRLLLFGGHELIAVPQILFEFWVVCTAEPPPQANGLGLSVGVAALKLDELLEVVTLLPDKTELLKEWRKLVTQFGITGRAAHDARLVAAMRNHGIAHILTFNVQHFSFFNGIAVIDPLTVTAASNP